jgi:hypothetical protein
LEATFGDDYLYFFAERLGDERSALLSPEWGTRTPLPVAKPRLYKGVGRAPGKSTRTPSFLEVWRAGW